MFEDYINPVITQLICVKGYLKTPWKIHNNIQNHY